MIRRYHYDQDTAVRASRASTGLGQPTEGWAMLVKNSCEQLSQILLDETARRRNMVMIEPFMLAPNELGQSGAPAIPTPTGWDRGTSREGGAAVVGGELLPCQPR